MTENEIEILFLYFPETVNYIYKVTYLYPFRFYNFFSISKTIGEDRYAIFLESMTSLPFIAMFLDVNP